MAVVNAEDKQEDEKPKVKPTEDKVQVKRGAEQRKYSLI